jgi:putative sterol carrier protein
MTMSEKFFSASWVREAIEAERSVSDEIYKRFRNPESFTHILAFDVEDRPGLSTYLEYVQGRAKSWTATPIDENRVWARFGAKLDVWRSAAQGQAKASNLVLSRKIKLLKGSLIDAVAAASPFNRLVRSWGDVDTDWHV